MATVEHEGVLLDVPGEWHELDTSDCEFGFARFGPADADACAFDHEGLAFYASATFDPKHGPGVLRRKRAAGAATSTPATGRSAATAATGSTRRILASARLEGQEAPDLSAGWRTESYEGLSVDVPASWQRGGLSAWCLDETVDRLGGDPRDRSSR